jgi:hypothetical protein
MFNVYLPKLLETGSSDENSTKSLEDSLWDFLIFSLGGCPGAIVCRSISLFYWLVWFASCNHVCHCVPLYHVRAREKPVFGTRKFGGDQS